MLKEVDVRRSTLAERGGRSVLNRTVKTIAGLIEKDVFPRIREKNLTVFLVGASLDKPNSVRKRVRKHLVDARPYGTRFDVSYAEDLFEELLWKGQQYNLLSLESLLAESVHCVVIILEEGSPGAIAELGAFSNHKKLRDRLVAVVDNDYRKHRSFIIRGPIRFLQANPDSEVIFHNLKKPDIPKLAKSIGDAIRGIAKRVSIDESPANPLAAPYLVLPAIYVLESASKKELEELMGVVSQEDAYTIVSIALRILTKKGELIREKEKYSLSPKGIESLRKLISVHSERGKVFSALDDARTRVLNATLRKRRPRRLEHEG